MKTIKRFTEGRVHSRQRTRVHAQATITGRAHNRWTVGGILGALLVLTLWATLSTRSLQAQEEPQSDLLPLENITQVSGGGRHTCALTTAGGVKCWGWNESGQIGDSTTRNDRPTPVDVTGLGTGVAEIAVGGYFSCALTTTGGVKCWGQNSRGQVGDGTTANRSAPVNVTGLTSGVSAIAAGGYHTCALTTGGGVKCWGDNFQGQLGDNTTTGKTTPADVAGLTSGVTAIAAGDSHTCALTTAGGIKCWGSNANGRLGDGTTTNRLTPVDVAGMSSGVAAIAAGYSHTCALTTGGGVKCWGGNSSGPLGDGTTTDRPTPVDVIGMGSGVTAIDTGFSHTCALNMAGGVKCWGSNSRGQVGDGTGAAKHSPADVLGLGSGIAAIGTGGFHSCAVSATGRVNCWGDNGNGQLGDSTGGIKLTPVDVVGLNSSAAVISAGSSNTCVLTTTGGVKCWGSGTLIPTDKAGMESGVAAIATGHDHTCALTTGGGIKCWGRGDFGQQGDGTADYYKSSPSDVMGLTSGVVAISSGDGSYYSGDSAGNHTCALTTAGGVKCWGRNLYGQLGDGTTDDRNTPVDVGGLTSGVTAIAVGGNQSCALTSAGGVKCWGWNVHGELGDGTTTNRSAPVDVTGLGSGIKAIAAGTFHTCALTTGGGVKCWGSDDHRTVTPVDVAGLGSGVDKIDAGNEFTCAVSTDGAAKCWGVNYFGTLGDGTTTDRSTPVDVVD